MLRNAASQTFLIQKKEEEEKKYEKMENQLNYPKTKKEEGELMRRF